MLFTINYKLIKIRKTPTGGRKMINKLVADEISRIMFEKDLTQKELGQLMGVSQQTAGEWQRRGNMPSERYEQFKEVFGVDIAAAVKAGQKITVKNSSGSVVGTFAHGDINQGATYPSPSHQYACELICDADEETAKKIIKLLLNNSL